MDRSVSRLNRIAGHLASSAQPAVDAVFSCPTSSASTAPSPAADALSTEKPNAEMRTLSAERQKAKFNVRKVTHWLHGSEEATKWMEVAALLLQRDPIFNYQHYYDLSRPEHRATIAAAVRRWFELKTTIKDPGLLRAVTSMINALDPSLGMKIYVHEVLFRESIWIQGTAEQWEQWKDAIFHGRVLGCYAMTELGHSSFLRGLETTATFDVERDEFIIHSPTVTATKVWIGMAGQTATHTVALAQLMINGENHGIHWFIVPLRRCDSGELMPGVTAGDIGHKTARNGLDNGWIQFTHVRVPRTNMLMKWAQVSRNGEFTAPSNPAISYASLVGERISGQEALYTTLAMACTIAIRYGAIRRQGPRDEQVLDYQTHYTALLPIVAGTYTFNSTFRRMSTVWQEMSKLQSNEDDMKVFLAEIPHLHAIAAGMKCWWGWWAAECLELCRRCMGGHGYSAYNSIADLIGSFGVMTTGGGDNVVLGQQHARYLLSTLQRAVSGKRIHPEMSFLRDLPSLLANQISTSQVFSAVTPVEVYLDALKWLMAKSLEAVAGVLSQLLADGADPLDGWNSNLDSLLACSRFHTFLVSLDHFREDVQKQSSPAEREVLRDLLRLFCVNRVHQEMSLFLEYQYLTPAQAKQIRLLSVQLAKDLRTQVVSLSDAFNYPDFVLRAPMGRFDGDIYRAYLDTMKAAPQCFGVPPHWKSSVSPLTNAKHSF
mmetsp:Transcript_41667/g.105060  ORF Transcript_41667/g.105060 Transcript_41667/m.105060 type:complete len:715 (-) Transcript_41667:77-2221(-)